MSSVPTDDRTTEARIRDATIELVAQGGLAAFTARGVAEAAGVSPGLVIHHFESMGGLRKVCDEYVLAEIRKLKTEAAEQGAAYDPMEGFKKVEGLPLSRYLAEVVTESSPTVDTLVDEMVADATVYMEQMVQSGLMKPSDDPQGRATIMVSMSLGNLMMRKHLERLLGVDITAPPTDPKAAAPYMRPMLELFHHGLTTDAAWEMMRGMLVDDGDEEGTSKESGVS